MVFRWLGAPFVKRSRARLDLLASLHWKMACAVDFARDISREVVIYALQLLARDFAFKETLLSFSFGENQQSLLVEDRLLLFQTMGDGHMSAADKAMAMLHAA